MDLTHFILLAVERSMISNKFGLDIFYHTFREAASNQQIETGDQGEGVSYKLLIKDNFFLAITMLAEALYNEEENPFAAMFDQMLVDRIETSDKRLVAGRSPNQNEDVLEILSEPCIEIYLIYLDQLRNLFTQYYHENFNAKHKKVRWETLAAKNSVMYVSAFLKMCRCLLLMPSFLDIEPLQVLIEDIIPPIFPHEQEYLCEKKVLDQLYRSDKEPKTSNVKPDEGNEPGLHFHEFIFLLGIIGLKFMDTSELAS